MRPCSGPRRQRQTGVAWWRVVLLSLIALPSAAQAADPQIDFMLECQGCHLADGSGKPGEVPALRDSMARFLEVPGGREFIVQVPGSALAPLDDEQLANVLNWMLDEFGPRAIAAQSPPYTAAEVGRLRATPLVDVAGARAALIERLPGETP